MNIKIIRSENDYQDALRVATTIAKNDPATGTGDAETLELLTLLIEEYERSNFSFDIPDPISAIEFRMEEQGLRQKDLTPILGSRSRVSEVLGRKRPLSLQMIRAISENLGISAEVLIRPVEAKNEVKDTSVDWTKFPFKEMQKRGWIPAFEQPNRSNIEIQVKEFIDQATGRATAPLFRRTLKGLGASDMEDRAVYSAIAWTARILQRANTKGLSNTRFVLDSINESTFQHIARLSTKPKGPVQAVECLNDIGITVVIEPQLSGTLLDGAAFLSSESKPVIGLTLRFDRVDYFWFTLLHELAHVWKHLNHPNEGYVDRIDASDESNRIEKEANRIARDSIISREEWSRSPARLNPTTNSILDFAAKINVHPALVAGRIRHETGDFRKFSKLLGQGAVRHLF